MIESWTHSRQPENSCEGLKSEAGCLRRGEHEDEKEFKVHQVAGIRNRMQNTPRRMPQIKRTAFERVDRKDGCPRVRTEREKEKV